MTSRPDPLTVLLTLAADLGLSVDPCRLSDDTTEAGTLAAPLREAPDLTPAQVAATDVLLRTVRLRRALVHDGLPASSTARYLMACARVTSRMLPATITDWAGRYRLTLDGNGHLPELEDLEFDVDQAARALEGYLEEHDRREWVDANAVAGAVADLLDGVRLVVVLAELNPAHSH